MNAFKQILTTYANEEFIQYLDHKEHEKCGQCHQEWLRYRLAKGYLASNKTDDVHMDSFFKEVKRQWEESDLFKIVKEHLNKGLSLEESMKKAEEQGYIP